jgi:hypothetical protein
MRSVVRHTVESFFGFESNWHCSFPAEIDDLLYPRAGRAFRNHYFFERSTRPEGFANRMNAEKHPSGGSALCRSRTGFSVVLSLGILLKGPHGPTEYCRAANVPRKSGRKRKSVFFKYGAYFFSGKPGSIIFYEQRITGRFNSRGQHTVHGMNASDLFQIAIVKRPRERESSLYLRHRAQNTI